MKLIRPPEYVGHVLRCVCGADWELEATDEPAGSSLALNGRPVTLQFDCPLCGKPHWVTVTREANDANTD